MDVLNLDEINKPMLHVSPHQLRSQLIANMLYGVSAQDPVTLAAVSVVLAAVAALAGWIPAWRAMRVDPMVALRYE